MSFVMTQPEFLFAAAGELSGIGSAVDAGNMAALGPTAAILPAGADEVSALTTAQFIAHAQSYQAVAAEAAAMHQQFLAVLSGNAQAYAEAEAANAAGAA